MAYIAQYYQPFLLPFLGKTRSFPSTGVARKYFFSFEDALWSLLAARNVPKGSVVLVPNFYCMDVLENIRAHGYTVEMYPLSEDFQIEPQVFLRHVQKHNPGVVVVFHACGITSNLTKHRSWVQALTPHTLIIEDAVHRLVNPSDVQIWSTNHVVIDSLRKVSPFPGSFIYGKPETISLLDVHSVSPLSGYGILGVLMYAFFRLCLWIAVMLRLPRVAAWAHTVALKWHDDLIGDALFGHRGIPGVPFLHSFTAFPRIKQIKERQAELYRKLLDPVCATFPHLVRHIHIPLSDDKKLHVYPLFVYGKPKRLIHNLHALGAIVWYKFEESPWSKRNGVLYLPLGPQVKQKDIQTIVEAITHAIE